MLLPGCEKHKDDIKEHIPNASLVVYSPAENSEILAGDRIHIFAKAISEETIHGYDISIKKLNDTLTYYSSHVHDHNDTLIIDQKWKDTISSPVMVEAIISLVLDHDNHLLVKRVPFKIL